MTNYKSIYTDRIHQPDLHRIDHLFFRNYPRARYDCTLQGQRVENGRIIMGCRAGPDCHVSNLIHEMAHLVEIDDARTFCPNWGLSYGKWIECNYSQIGGWYERNTPAHILREIRVWAYQFSVSRWLGHEETADRLASSSTYLPDTFLIKKIVPSLDVPWSEFDQAFVQWVKNEIERLSAAHSVERFCSEWHRKLTLTSWN